MEEKRFDPYQFIGFVLIALILTWMLYVNRSEEVSSSDTQPRNTEAVKENQQPSPIQLNDSLHRINLQSTFGIFSNWMVDRGAKNQKIENRRLLIEVNLRRALSLVRLKEYSDYLDRPLDLIKDGNNKFNIQFTTKDGRRLNTRDFYFFPSLTNDNGKQKLSLKANINLNQYLEFIYRIDTESFC